MIYRLDSQDGLKFVPDPDDDDGQFGTSGESHEAVGNKETAENDGDDPETSQHSGEPAAGVHSQEHIPIQEENSDDFPTFSCIEASLVPKKE